MILVRNESPLVSPSDFTRWIEAIDQQVSNEYANAWSVIPPFIRDANSDEGRRAPRTSPLIRCIDVIDVPDALGYHNLTGDRVVGLIGVKSCLDNGASVSQCLSHEVLEACKDPYCGGWEDNQNDGTSHAREMCFAGDTQIAMADGSTRSISSLVGGDFEVRAFDRERIVRARATARMTARDLDTVHVMFSDGSRVECTPNHRFMLCDGAWVEARDLTNETELQFDFSPTTPAVSGHSVFGGSVEHVLVVRSDEEMIWTHTSRVVARMANLFACWYRSVTRRVSETVGKYVLLSAANLAISPVVFVSDPNPAIGRFLHEAPKELFARGSSNGVSGIPFGRARAFQSPKVHPTQSVGPKRARTTGNRAGLHRLNVVTVERSVKQDVYDLTVPGFGNFVLANGAVVHNCDAVQDGVYQINGVDVSNFLFPAWFDSQNISGPFDQLDVLMKPFTRTPGGYQIVRIDGKETQLGSKPPWKQGPNGRAKLRMDYRL